MTTGKLLYDLMVRNVDHYQSANRIPSRHWNNILMYHLAQCGISLQWLDWRCFARQRLVYFAHLPVELRLRLARLQLFVDYVWFCHAWLFCKLLLESTRFLF